MPGVITGRQRNWVRNSLADLDRTIFRDSANSTDENDGKLAAIFKFIFKLSILFLISILVFIVAYFYFVVMKRQDLSDRLDDKKLWYTLQLLLS